MTKIVSWNVNGVRSCLGKGLLQYLEREAADVVCLQEVKATPADVAHVAWPLGYHVHWNAARRPGYSGTALLTRTAPLAVSTAIGERTGDAEGRVVHAEYPAFHVVGVYTPNAQAELTRLSFRVRTWDVRFRQFIRLLDASKPVIFCGDLNVAHEEIDIARPRENAGQSGFTDQERASFSRHLAAGFIDTFRTLHPDTRDAYSWWTYRAGARERNIGWRIDYVCCSARLRPALHQAFIRPEVTGSDHCPVGASFSL